MIELDLLPFFTFITVTTFTPGPNNVSSASMGLNFGYRKSLPYLFGILFGVAAVTFACGLISGPVLTAIPSVSRWLRWLGAAYILWLAWGTLRADWAIGGTNIAPRLMGFPQGVLLQLLNPKLFVFAVSLFATFLQPLAGKPLPLLILVLLLSVVDFSSISLWSLSGAALNRHIGNSMVRKAVNASLALLLVYTAVAILKL